jgi:cobalt-zinc-cadmium efflux system outer membrane protein
MSGPHSESCSAPVPLHNSPKQVTQYFATDYERIRTSQGVQQSVQERTGKIVRWEEDQAADEGTLRDVRLLLRKPLTAESSVQIALLNNRSLQATFEEIGLSAADLIEAGTIPNPKIDLAIRFPDKPPSGTYIDYSEALDFLSIIMIPMKKRTPLRWI